MSSLVLIKAIACLVVIISSFALVVSCVQVRSFFLFLTMSMRVGSGRSTSMRVGLLASILRFRVPMDSILF
jgi:hypothetical protein